MIHYKNESFSHSGKAYDIRVYYTKNLINTVVFSDNYPASGIRHQIQLPKTVNSESILEHDIISDFIQMAKNDIIEDRWHRISQLFPDISPTA